MPDPSPPCPRDAPVLFLLVPVNSKLGSWLCVFMTRSKTEASVCFQKNQEEG